MASSTVYSSDMELLESARARAVATPDPLRIIKRNRANAISSGTGPRPDLLQRRLSISSTISVSPPDRNHPINIPRRRARADSSFDGNCDAFITGKGIFRSKNENSSEYEISKGSRTSSIESFVRPDLLADDLGSDNSMQLLDIQDSDRRQTVIIRRGSNSQGTSSFSEGGSDAVSRQSSHGRKFVRKALTKLGGIRHSESLKSFAGNKLSKPPHYRPLSGETYPRYTYQEVSAKVSPSLNVLEDFLRTSYDSRDRSFSSSSRFPENSLFAILYPNITITSEFRNIVSGEEKSMWIAIRITAALTSTISVSHQPMISGMALIGEQIQGNTIITAQFSSSNKSEADSDCGYLYDVVVNIKSLPGCTITEVISCSPETTEFDRWSSCQRITEDYVTFHHGQAKLLLVQVLINPVSRPSEFGRQSSLLLEELEAELGQSRTDYLEIRVSYCHSLHLASEGFHGLDGTSQTTTTITQTRASIRRYVPNASWAPKPTDIFQGSDAIVDLILSHCTPVKAQEIIQRVTSCKQILSTVTRRRPHVNSSVEESGDTITLADYSSCTEFSPNQQILDEHTETPRRPVPSRRSFDHTPATMIRWPSKEEQEPLTPTPVTHSEQDPARKIWCDMRRVSRGSTESERKLRKITAARTSSPDSSPVPNHNFDSPEMQREPQVGHEELRIRELAVRNKRSIGADTLRSLTYSPSQLLVSDGKGFWKGWWG